MIRVIEPATAEVMAEVPRAGAEEVDAAVERARRAFPDGVRWRPPTARACSTGWRTSWTHGARSWPSSRPGTRASP